MEEERRYAETHEWATPVEGGVRVGISAFAQSELGEVVFVDLPEAGAAFDAGEPMALVESIKAVSDVYAPVSGTVRATNERLNEQPELVNEDPLGAGWMVELATDESLDDLLSAAAYDERV